MSINDVMVEWADEFVQQFGSEIELSGSQIRNEVTKRGLKPISIVPSDHCYNRANNDPTSVSGKTALFIYIERNLYRCVGSQYEYSGPIYCRPRGAGKDIVWGSYANIRRQKIHCPETSKQSANQKNNKKITQIYSGSNERIESTPGLKIEIVLPQTKNPNFSSLETKPLDRGFVVSIERFLQSKQKLYDSPIVKCVEERKNGHKFTQCDHLRGYIYAQLSNNRPWSTLEPHLPEIDDIFCNYDVSEILSKLDSIGYEYFLSSTTNIRCGNRGINAQMQNLEGNIGVFTNLIDRYGSLDEFVTSRPVLEIIEMLSSAESPYKLRTMGIPLTAEYLRNVGIDCSKPDVHMCRIFGNNRLGLSSHEISSVAEVFQFIADLSVKTGYSQASIDNILWSYCAEGYGGVCSSKPNCDVCVIQDYCRRGN